MLHFKIISFIFKNFFLNFNSHYSKDNLYSFISNNGKLENNEVVVIIQFDQILLLNSN